MAFFVSDPSQENLESLLNSNPPQNLTSIAEVLIRFKVSKIFRKKKKLSKVDTLFKKRPDLDRQEIAAVFSDAFTPLPSLVLKA